MAMITPSSPSSFRTFTPHSPFPPPPYSPSIHEEQQNCDVERQDNNTTHIIHSLFLVIVRMLSYVYFGWILTQNDNADNAFIITQYKTSNALGILLAVMSYAVLGVSKALGTMMSLFCLMAIILDSYMTVVLGMQINNPYFYVSLLPNLGALILYNKLKKV